MVPKLGLPLWIQTYYYSSDAPAMFLRRSLILKILLLISTLLCESLLKVTTNFFKPVHHNPGVWIPGMVIPYFVLSLLFIDSFDAQTETSEICVTLVLKPIF